MVLVIDIENKNIVLGLFEGKRLKYHWKIATDIRKTEDEWAMMIKSLFDYENLSFHYVKGIIISSVVPMIMQVIEQMCKKYFRLLPLIIGPGIKTGLNIKYDNPREVGADRIVNAVCATHFYEGPLIIVKFGTAISYCYINEKHEYEGGAIAPGMTISTEALYTHASKLPRIEVVQPPNLIGKNTVHAMQAGIFYGFVGQVDHIITLMKRETNTNPTVIATGEIAELIAKESKQIDVVEPFLTLKGLQIIYEKNS